MRVNTLHPSSDPSRRKPRATRAIRRVSPASYKPGHNGINIPAGNKPHNPPASVDHLQSSVLAVVRHGLAVRFPRCQPTALDDSKYLDKMLASSIVDRSERDFSYNPSVLET
ncbi:unnamed protein product [Lasius platythorax]|uniref:Uncharacterized protein n=1 Tax=Lasius platythorax TaxID=488582 RepID=A0AAV2P2Z0_9HYME